ncbi:calcium-binding protein [Poseidonocella sp. HB161398]|uniref:calcium-binding protein n=1 Tax=Poseidonocella sp. HB161398 TaxID=2320855 RepID=UPI001486C8DC|nr:hypothetical protein [Poseidonocella sp. HB161398]
MAHLGSSYSSYEAFLNRAEAFWTVDLAAMNNSGVTGDALLAVSTEEDGTRYLNISISAEGLTPDVQHAQHVHGTFNEDGTPSDARMPVTADDADQDGFVEVLEGLAAYGDILLPLVDGGGALPMTRADGTLDFIQSYDLGDGANFFSPVSGNDYDADDLMPLESREIVLHGQVVGAGFGAGTGGEIDGTQDGYVGLLPVAAGEIEATSREQALDILEDQFERASVSVHLGGGDDVFDGGAGNDTVHGGAGKDRIEGGADDDHIRGNAQSDVLRGGSGDDRLYGNEGRDRLFGDDGNDLLVGGRGVDALHGGEGNDTLDGHKGADALHGGGGDDKLDGQRGADALDGGAGNDILKGRLGDDVLTGGDGNDLLYGGYGWDEFAYADMDEGDDVIGDFEDGVDLITLAGLGLGMDDLSITEAGGGTDAMIEFGSTSILLADVTVDQLDQGDFLF